MSFPWIRRTNVFHHFIALYTRNNSAPNISVWEQTLDHRRSQFLPWTRLIPRLQFATVSSFVILCKQFESFQSGREKCLETVLEGHSIYSSSSPQVFAGEKCLNRYLKTQPRFPETAGASHKTSVTELYKRLKSYLSLRHFLQSTTYQNESHTTKLYQDSTPPLPCSWGREGKNLLAYVVSSEPYVSCHVDSMHCCISGMGKGQKALP